MGCKNEYISQKLDWNIPDVLVSMIKWLVTWPEGHVTGVRSRIGVISWPRSQLRAGDLLCMCTASWEPLILLDQDLGVIQCVLMTGQFGVFLYGRVRVVSISVFSEPGSQHSICFTNVLLVALTALNTADHPTPFLLLDLSLCLTNRDHRVLQDLW